MIHKVLSLKLSEDLYNRLAKIASITGTSKHAFVITTIEEILSMIDNRGCEKIPLLVMQARVAEDYNNKPPVLKAVQAPTAKITLKRTDHGYSAKQ